MAKLSFGAQRSRIMFGGSYGGGAPVPTVPIYMTTYGDSRSDLMGGGTTGPNMNDGVLRNLRTGYTYSATTVNLPIHLTDVEIVANGGLSGDAVANWASATRNSSTRTVTQTAAIPSDVVEIEYGINDIRSSVSDATTRDSVSAAVITNLKNCIDYWYNTGRKVIWRTIMQCSAAGYSTNPTFKRDAVDIVNAAMITWVQAHSGYGTQIIESDIRAATNVGGATSGAYLETANGWTDDGIHANFTGGYELGRIDGAALRTLFPSRGFLPLKGLSGKTNLITAVDATTVKRFSITNGTGSASYGTDANGNKYIETTVTVTGTSSRLTLEIAADVGTNGGRTPPNTISVGDLLKGRCFITVDDGSGGIPTVVGNVYTSLNVNYIGGTPAAQTVTNGSAVSTALRAIGSEFNMKAHQFAPITLTGDSSLIGAPASLAGLRLTVIVYGLDTLGTGTFRVRVTAPFIGKYTA